MNRVVLVALGLCALASFVSAVCWTAGPYHIAASAMATGIGNVSSSAVCVYGNDTTLNAQCPFPCASLLRATWGDCYCRDPTYKPDSNGADPFVRPMTVQQMYMLLATEKWTKGAYCRDWLNANPTWKCDS